MCEYEYVRVKSAIAYISSFSFRVAFTLFLLYICGRLWATVLLYQFCLLAVFVIPHLCCECRFQFYFVRRNFIFIGCTKDSMYLIVSYIQELCKVELPLNRILYLAHIGFKRVFMNFVRFIGWHRHLNRCCAVAKNYFVIVNAYDHTFLFYFMWNEPYWNVVVSLRSILIRWKPRNVAQSELIIEKQLRKYREKCMANIRWKRLKCSSFSPQLRGKVECINDTLLLRTRT